MTPVRHTPYSPDLAPSYLFLFPWMKKVLTGKQFDDVEEVKQKMGKALKASKSMSGENISIGVFRQIESTLTVTEV